ncbi:MAG: hypothetical protein L0J63_13515 [Tetragenococcus koreensis]|nr:hypothetical protein [Tetragenococcus koreensis]
MEKKLELLKQRNSTMTCVFTGSKKIVTLVVEENDLVINADENIDCSLETILRKNRVGKDNIHEWGIENIQLIEVSQGTEKILHQYDPKTISNLLQF